MAQTPRRALIMFDMVNRSPELVWNVDLLMMDVMTQPSLISRTVVAQPATSGSDDGKMWATTSTATGSEWEDNRERLAIYYTATGNTGWTFVDIPPGIYWIEDTSAFDKWDGSSWSAAAI